MHNTTSYHSDHIKLYRTPALTADIEKIIAINSCDFLICVDDIHKEKPGSKVFSFFNRIIKGFKCNSRELQKRINNAEGIEHVESDTPQLSYSDETLCQGNAWDYANQGIWQPQNNSRSTMEHQAVTSTLQCLRVGPTCQEVSTYQKESCQSHCQTSLMENSTTFLVPDTYIYERVNRVKKT